jgi:phage tail sheath protein FI
VYVARVVGPAAVSASKNLLDAGAAISLVASEIGPGSYGNSYKVAVLTPLVAGYRIQVQDTGGVPLETSPDLADQPAAVNWAKNSSYIRIALGVSSNNPAVAAGAALASGNDDRASITDTQWLNALTTFTNDLGPGQVSMPGRTTDTAHQQLMAHADALNRSAILDLPDTATTATLLTSVQTARGSVGKRGASFAPWVITPGIVVGTTRTVPPSALVAAKCAKTDAEFNPNTPAAGTNGVADYAIDVSQPAWDGATRNTLNSGGVNVIRNMFGAPRIYGWRSMVDSVAEPSWLDFGNSRLYMAIAAEANNIAETYVLKEIDGQGIVISAFGGALKGMLIPYFTEGALYGQTPDEAFFVDVGVQVNTPTRLANNELHAVISLRMSPFAELVVIEIVKVGTTESVV